jgi:hypothetical protein
VNIEDLLVSDPTARKSYSASRIMTVLDGAGGGATARTEMTATYSTPSTDATVYYTGLHTDGSILSARSTSGVTFASGLYQKVQSTVGMTDFIAVWDEGDPTDYSSEWITVDT